jgi:hypothetical protein
MQQSFIIEVRITDLIERHPTIIDNSIYHLDIIRIFENQLEEIIGGMLCLDHVNLPEIQPLKDFGDSWILQIACCCKIQSRLVEDRLNKILK